MRIIFILLLFIPLTNIKSQETPHLNDGLVFVTEYIASQEFTALKDEIDDISQIDSIFARTLKFYNNDISEALLALTFATLPYNELPINIFGIDLPIPLPNVGGEIYREKNFNLPKNIFIDSPQNNFGDKDKLAHFFGNAFIGYNFKSMNASIFLGAFVEIFESSFYKNARVDRRDIMVNFLGKNFGSNLNEDKKLLPSSSLKLYNLFFMKFSFNFIN